MTLLLVGLLALTLVFAFLFFQSQFKLGRLARFASDLAEGKKVSSLYEKREPFKGLVRDIDSLARTLEDRVQAAREGKRRLFAILESMTEGVLVVDTEQKALLVNSALEKGFGFERSAVEGRYYWEIFRDADINAMIEHGLVERVAAKKEHSSSLSKVCHEIQVSPVFSKDEFLGVVVVFRDVTMLKEFDRLRMEFVANVSHELKTPLTSILGFVETLREGGMEDPENRMKFLKIIESQSRSLHTLIEDLLYLSRIESSLEPLRREEVDVDALFERMRERFAPILKENRLQMQSVSSVKTVLVQGEPSSLERALSNLVDNAVKYNRPGGRITLQATTEPGWVTLEVRDTGIGISALDQERIFERFYRVDKSRSRELGGTGLGLSITKHIVERHGGQIRVQSTPGQGSTFSIVLPS